MSAENSIESPEDDLLQNLPHDSDDDPRPEGDAHPYYNVTLHMKVFDAEMLYEAAKKQAISDGVQGYNSLLKPGGVISIQDCLRMVLDPGTSPPGVDIMDSTVD